MSPVYAVIPIALAILAGWLARRSNIVAAGHWPGIEAVSFRLLIPAILISAIARADLSPDTTGALALALIATIALTGGAVLALRMVFPREHLSNPSLSTLFQVATRYNAFISLAAADLIAGPEGVALIAISMAVMIPIINVANIVTIAALCSGTASAGQIARTVARNPLIIGCAIGLLANALGGLPQVIDEAVGIVGRAALGVGLLTVGAGLSLKRFLTITPNIALGVAFRPVVAPLVFLLCGTALGLSLPEMMAGLLVTAVPAATNGYVVAKAMGGDADLYADVMGWQTLASLVAIPAFLYVAGTLAV